MTWRKTFFVSGLLVFLVAGYVIYQGAREGAAAVCASNLYQVAHTVCHIHPSDRLILPPAYLCDKRGVALHSWRTLAAETVDIDPAVRYTFSEVWNGPTNDLFAKEKPFGRLYTCPRDRQAAGSSCTSYVAVMGTNTLWREQEWRDLTELGPEVREKILLIEIPHSDIVWTEPRDITLEEALRLFSARDGLQDTRHPQGLYYITVGLEIRPISSIASVEEFAAMLETKKEDTQKLTAQKLIGQRGRHGGQRRKTHRN